MVIKIGARLCGMVVLVEAAQQLSPAIFTFFIRLLLVHLHLKND